MSTSRTPVADGTAIGLRTTPMPDTSKVSGSSPLPTMAKTMKAAPDQATSRQRGDSSRPVGKYSGRSISRIQEVGAKANPPARATTRPPGSEPGAVTSV
jgi:hypothetical protein